MSDENITIKSIESSKFCIASLDDPRAHLDPTELVGLRGCNIAANIVMFFTFTISSQEHLEWIIKHLMNNPKLGLVSLDVITREPYVIDSNSS